MGEVLRERVVLVHGLGMGPWVMGYLKAGLEVRGYACGSFGYHTTSVPFEVNVRRLGALLRELEAPRLHLVAHSMGGLLALAALRREEGLPPGRVVLIASPLRGSSVARALGRWGWARRMLRESYAPLALGSGEWLGEREVGVIAGSVKFGPGLLFHDRSLVTDGTVTLEETRLPGIAAHVTLPASHTALLAYPRTLELTARFLAQGRF